MVIQKDQTLGDFEKPNQSKAISNDFIELVLIPSSLEQPKNEEEEIDELPRDDSANDIATQELVEHEEKMEQSLHQKALVPQAKRSTKEHHPSTRYSSSKYMLIIDKKEQ